MLSEQRKDEEYTFDFKLNHSKTNRDFKQDDVIRLGEKGNAKPDIKFINDIRPHIIEVDFKERRLSKGDERSMTEEHNRINDLKEDVRESERRTSQNIKEREERFERQLQSYVSDAKEREERFFKESKEREERIITALNKMEEKTEKSLDRIDTMKSQNFWGNIALFAAMLAIVITLIIQL